MANTAGILCVCNGKDRTLDLDIDSFKIETSVSDRMPQIELTIEDTGCNNPVDTFQEIILIDQSTSNPTVNLLLDPLFAHSPLGSLSLAEPQPPNATGGWWAVLGNSSNYGTISAASNIATMSVSNTLLNTVLSQTTQPYTVTPGVTYCFSVSMNITGAMSGANVYLLMEFLDTANYSVLGSTTQTATSTSGYTLYTLQAAAPTGTGYIRLTFGIQITNGSSNSGTVNFTYPQLEPVWFPYLQSYPTPLASSTSPGCYVMPNGTTVRQKRLFAGIIIDADPGSLGDDSVGYIGPNRTWTVGCRGPNWILDSVFVNGIYQNFVDQTQIQSLASSLLANRMTTNNVQAGATFDQRSYDDITLSEVLTDMCNTSGFSHYVDMYYDLHYEAVGSVQAPYALSDGVNVLIDNVNVFPYYEWSCPRDATQVGNRVTVHGGPFTGTKTDTFTANGSQKQFTLTQEKIKEVTSITVNGTEQTKAPLGNSNFTFSNYQVLIDFPNHQINWQNNLANGASVVCTYIFDAQVRHQEKDYQSYLALNQIWIDKKINDPNITTTNAAIQRALQELAQWSLPLKMPHFKVAIPLVPGAPQPGWTIQISNAQESMSNAPFLIQKVTVVLKSNGVAEYELECGADLPTFTRLQKRLSKSHARSKQLAGTALTSQGLAIHETISIGGDSYTIH